MSRSSEAQCSAASAATAPPSAVADSREDGRRVQSLFSRIAGVYDLLNHVLSFGMDIWWRRQLVRSVLPFPPSGTARILDLAAGTMDVSVALAKRHPRRLILAMDFCRPMLVKGLAKRKRLKKGRIEPAVADGRSLPLPDNSVDAITIAFGLRNIRPREEAYAEALRVLVPGGRFCVLEFGSARDRILFGLYNAYLTYLLPLIGRIVSRDPAAYRYLADTIREYPSARELEAEMGKAGFTQVRHKRLSAGIVCLHTGEKPLR